MNRCTAKVNGKDDSDFCKKEFKYAVLRKKPLLPVVMEEYMKDVSKPEWKGSIGFNLGTQKYTSMADDEGLDKACEELVQILIKRLSG